MASRILEKFMLKHLIFRRVPHACTCLSTGTSCPHPTRTEPAESLVAKAPSTREKGMLKMCKIGTLQARTYTRNSSIGTGLEPSLHSGIMALDIILHHLICLAPYSSYYPFGLLRISPPSIGYVKNNHRQDCRQHGSEQVSKEAL